MLNTQSNLAKGNLTCKVAPQDTIVPLRFAVTHEKRKILEQVTFTTSRSCTETGYFPTTMLMTQNMSQLIRELFHIQPGRRWYRSLHLNKKRIWLTLSITMGGRYPYTRYIEGVELVCNLAQRRWPTSAVYVRFLLPSHVAVRSSAQKNGKRQWREGQWSSQCPT